MSIMVLREIEFVEIKNYLLEKELKSIKLSDENVLKEWMKVTEKKCEDLVTYFYKMNVLNYCNKYKEAIDFDPINFDLSKTYDENDMKDLLSSLRYNICDYFKTPELDRLIEEFE